MEDASLRAMLAPRTVAIVGVSSRTESLSGRLFENLKRLGYAGTVYPVNPRAQSIGGLRCYPSVSALPAGVDLAIVMVPRDAAADTLSECVAAGVKGIVVITAGFREVGEEGAAAERELLRRLEGSGVRMIGPNCMGVINTAAGVRLDATFSPAPVQPGGVAFASHSGALGVAVLEAAREAGLGFAQFASLGNSADVTVCDLLELWGADDDVRVIMLYLEALDEPRRFLELASGITAVKPVVAVKAGRTRAGQRAASSHTGALAAEDSAAGALLAQAGVLRADTLEEMLALVAAFERVPLPAGRRVALVTNAGGPAIVAADALAAEALSLATLSSDTTGALRAFLPPEAAVGNPVDMLPSATPEHYRRALELVLADDGVDAAVVIVVTPILVRPEDIARQVAAVTGAAAKPVLAVFMTNPAFYAAARDIGGLPPVYRFPEAAVRALGGMARQVERVERGVLAVPATPSRLTLPPRDGYLDPGETFSLLEAAGVPVAPWRLARTAGEVVAAGREVGFPAVLKAYGAGIVHKTEVGAVVVGLGDGDALREAVAAMQGRLAAHGEAADGFLVQRQIVGGREMIAGVTRDPAVGPLVMCGLGGVAVEVLADVSFRVAPVGTAEAGRMIGELRGAPLLGAFRGRPPADTGAFAETLARLAGLAAAHPEIAECDLNPVLLLDEGQGCVAVDARIRLAR